MRKVLAALVFAAIVTVGGAVVFVVWDLDLRWRPHTVTRDQAEIARILDQSGWVSPHLTGPKLYMVAYRDCAACTRVADDVFPRLQAADVDTRVIMVARPDANGLARSKPAERATVAELWTNRSWKLYQQWMAARSDDWTAPGAPAADGDAARTAVVEAGRFLATQLPPLMRRNGVRFAYPTLVWWTKDGHMRACACTDPQTYRFVEKELGA
jgi:hypothetical protein